MTRYTPVLMDLIQKPCVMELLVYIGDHPDCSKNSAIGFENARTRYLRIEEMAEWGLIDVQSPNGQYNACKLNLTERGKELYGHMKDICSVAERIQREEDGKVQS